MIDSEIAALAGILAKLTPAARSALIDCNIGNSIKLVDRNPPVVNDPERSTQSPYLSEAEFTVIDHLIIAFKFCIREDFRKLNILLDANGSQLHFLVPIHTVTYEEP